MLTLQQAYQKLQGPFRNLGYQWVGTEALKGRVCGGLLLAQKHSTVVQNHILDHAELQD